MVTENTVSGQYSPGQYPPVPISPRVILFFTNSLNKVISVTIVWGDIVLIPMVLEQYPPPLVNHPLTTSEQF